MTYGTYEQWLSFVQMRIMLTQRAKKDDLVKVMARAHTCAPTPFLYKPADMVADMAIEYVRGQLDGPAPKLPSWWVEQKR